MAFPILLVALVLLMIDSLIEVGFVGSTVGYLHKANGGQPFEIVGNGSTVLHLGAKPKHLSVDQGHTSNGAAGTALILVGVFGCIVLWHQNRLNRSSARPSSTIFLAWIGMTVLSFLLTTAALIYTFLITEETSGQNIDLSNPALNSNTVVGYPLDKWTPETWYTAVLQLPFVHEDEKSGISSHLKMMRGWRWNLIPLFLLGLTIVILAVMELLKIRRRQKGISYSTVKA